MSRGLLRPVAILVLATGAVLWPIVRQPQQDGFPLSNYPMFTQERPQITSIDLIVGIDAAGRELTLAPEVIGGSVEVIQAASAVSDAISAGESPEICLAAAVRAAEADSGAQRLLVVTDTYDVIDGLKYSGPPAERPRKSREIHAECTVTG